MYNAGNMMAKQTVQKTYLFTSILLLMVLNSTVKADYSAVNSEHWDSRYDEMFRKYSGRYFGPHFDWRWFKAQAIAESGLQKGAMSPSGARGLMQILPSTYQEIKQTKPYIGNINDPSWNIAAGIFYLRNLFRRWQGRPDKERLYLALASYNAGYYRILKAFRRVKGTDKKWTDIKMHIPGETREYVERIRRLMNDKRTLRMARMDTIQP